MTNRRTFRVPPSPVTFVVTALLASCNGSIEGGAADPSGPSTAGPGPRPGTSSPSNGAGPSASTGGPSPGSSAPGDPTGGETPGPVSSGQEFSCKPGAAEASPARLWRLSAEQYANTARALVGGNAGKLTFTNPFQGATSDERFTSIASPFGMPEATFQQVVSTARELAGQLLPQLQAAHPCLAAPDAACLRPIFSGFVARAYRRPVTADEVDRLIGLVTRNTTHGAGPAVSLALQAVLSSPHFLFRTELGDDKPDASGRRRLTGHELASALAYTLTDGPPDEMLRTAADTQALKTPEQIRAHAARLLGTPAENPAMRRFVREYLGYERTLDVFKDAKEFPFHDAKALMEETELWLGDVLRARRDFLKHVFTATDGYARGKTAPSYGVTASGTAPQKVTFPVGQRSGILTQPSFLSGFSEADHNDPIRRGKFMLETFLCETVPSIPPGVVPVVPEVPNGTMRERLAAHRNAAEGCPACHNLIDPMGLALERYDHVGRHRTTEYGKTIDTSGELKGIAPDVDGAFEGPLDLAARLAKAASVERCFVRHEFRYWMGREETQGDTCALSAAQAALRTGGDPANALLALVTSDVFLYRTAAK